MARLGVGCTALTHLDMSGFVNLSDGMQRDFAFTGIQVRGQPAAFTSYGKTWNKRTHWQTRSRGSFVLTGDTQPRPPPFQHQILGTKPTTSAHDQALARGCTELQTLILDGCFQVSKTALRAIGGGLHSLKTLSLARCPALTLEGMSALANGCPSLTNLNLPQ